MRVQCIANKKASRKMKHKGNMCNKHNRLTNNPACRLAIIQEISGLDSG